MVSSLDGLGKSSGMKTPIPDSTRKASWRASDCSNSADIGDLSEVARAAFEAVPDALAVIDGGGTVRFANRRLAALCGHSTGGLVGSNVEELISTRSRRRYGHLRARYSSDGALPPFGRTFELYGRRRDGSEFPAEVVASPVRALEQPLVVVTVRDVSARRRIRRDLDAARLAAEQDRRSAMQASLEKSRFLAAASHDLRQPLQALALLNGTLRRTVRNPTASEAVLQQRRAIEAMSRLVNALLDISKLESGAIRPEPREFAVGELFEELHTEFASLAAANGLELRIETAVPRAYSDPSLLGQILRNLVSNAIKYTHNGWVQLRSAPSAGGACLEVVDTGIGIAAEQLPRIYEEFYQIGSAGRSSEGGYGLGLSIVRRLVTLLNLKLEVRSRIGEGSCFALHVPSRDVGSLSVAPIIASDGSESRVQASGSMRDLDTESFESGAPLERDAVAMIAHDMRGPLAVMCNVVRACRSGEGLSRLPNALEILDRQVGKALRLVDDLLDVSRSRGSLSHLATSPVDLAAVVGEVAKDLSHELQSRDQRLTLQLPSGPVWIRGDAIRLARVVWNLLDNASKCSGTGQAITIDLRCEHDWAVLGVRDAGIGILPEDLTRIFRPFVRGRDPSRSERPGIGLGLAITRRLVTQHGGSIVAYSQGHGYGSEFTVRLPVASREG